MNILFDGDLGVAVNAQVGADSTGLGIDVDTQLGAYGPLDVAVDPHSRARQFTWSGSIVDLSDFLLILLDLGFLLR